ncbi:diguanylate cyclase [Guyparkeria halophila]|uniref:diguanylate cyclase n=1 Tax=Guyparkeria halophila TaxID=47960 RepID=A0A6I6D352_9GAMM|nr:sensor domain-containing diguanylate cyclase [Guyparkeria halophila]QGT77761.1 diguanylate cyclase [Guyparkeria halophila]
MQRNKLLFATALTVLLTLGFVATSVIGYFVAEDSLEQQIAEETLPLTSDNIFSEIERDLLRSILISSLMAHDTFVRDWVVEGEEDPEAIIRYLAEIQQKYETTTAFFVAESSRRYYHPDGVLTTVTRANPADAWYFRVRETNEPFEINIDHDTAEPSRLSIFVNYRVEDEAGEYIGVTGIGLAVETVAGLIESYQRRYGRSIYFINREGEITLRGSGYDGPERIQEQPGLARHAIRILTSPSTDFAYERPGIGTTYVNTRLIPELDWFLVVEQRESSANARLLNTLIVNILLALGVTALVLLTGGWTLRNYQRRLETMATTDRLTGARNRQALEVLFEQARRLGRRHDQPISIINLDIDHFKAINDGHGHQAGDRVLKELVDTVSSQIREIDTLCRWGGDEFLILLQDTDADRARLTAERIREAVVRRHGSPQDEQGEEAWTVSQGVAQCRENESLDSLIHRADKALYRAKRNGRNQVAVAEPG